MPFFRECDTIYILFSIQLFLEFWYCILIFDEFFSSILYLFIFIFSELLIRWGLNFSNAARTAMVILLAMLSPRANECKRISKPAIYCACEQVFSVRRLVLRPFSFGGKHAIVWVTWLRYRMWNYSTKIIWDFFSVIFWIFKGVRAFFFFFVRWFFHRHSSSI